MFANASLAKRIEQADASLSAGITESSRARLSPDRAIVQPLAGGIAVFMGPGSPYNKTVGVGFEGAWDLDTLAALERAFDERDTALQFEISTLADPAVVKTLTARGYLVVGFENVLGMRVAAPGNASADVRVTQAGPDTLALWIETMIEAYGVPDSYDGPPMAEAFPRDVLERIFGDTARAGLDRYLAWRGDQVAGAATMRVHEGIAQFCGAATLAAHRRQGVQGALLRHRLDEAASRGADVAVVTTTPGSTSQANAQKAGFSLLYARALLQRPVGG